MIVLVALHDKYGTIASNGKQPYLLRKDMVQFQQITTNQAVVMGRKTYDTLDRKAFKNRVTIVLSHHDPDNPECMWMESVDQVLSYHDWVTKMNPNMLVCIIGGEEVYRQFLPYAKIAMVTQVEDYWENPTAKFPKLDAGRWELIAESGEIIDTYFRTAPNGDIIRTMLYTNVRYYSNITVPFEYGKDLPPWLKLI